MNNEISRRSFMKIFTRSHSSEDLRCFSSETLGKIFRRKDFKKIWIKTFSSKNLQKIFIYFLQKIFKQFLPKYLLRSLKDLQSKSFWDLWKIFNQNLFEIFWRSSGLFLNFKFKKNCQTAKNGQKIFWRSSNIIFRQSSFKS